MFQLLLDDDDNYNRRMFVQIVGNSVIAPPSKHLRWFRMLL